MDISVFFKPLATESFLSKVAGIAQNTKFHSNAFPDLEGVHLAIVGVMAENGARHNTGCADAVKKFREKFYKLSSPSADLKIADLGDIAEGASPEDTAFAIRETCLFLLKNKIIPIVIGGSQDHTYAMYTAFEHLEQTVNLVTVDHRLDVGELKDLRDSENYLSHIILHQPNFLFNYSNIGHQRSIVSADLIDLMDKMFFDLYRLGDVSGNIHDMEPVIRNADIFSFDFSAIRASDAPGNAKAGPNGLFAQEACQLCRQAGMSDKLSLAGFFEYNPHLDERGINAQLLAEMVWYFIEGYVLRKGDYPNCDTSAYTRYIVDLDQHQLVFYKSDRSDRWWMDVPYPSGTYNKYERHHLVPCTYKDYQMATNEDLPDRWWRTYQKLV